MKRKIASKTEKQKTTAGIEKIFAHAVALEQLGRLKNTIYVTGKKIFIKNAENTVLLRFFSPDGSFSSDISFNANDYEGDSFHVKEGSIIFETFEKEYHKKKSCKSPGQTPKEINKLFKSFESIETNKITLNSDVLSLLDTSLSHIELSVKKGTFILTQRNIYSGAIIEITKASSKGGLGISSDKLSETIKPIGLRTSDFHALFSFQNTLNFYLDPDQEYITVTGQRWKMRAVISTCLYDELGEINYVKKEK